MPIHGDIIAPRPIVAAAIRAGHRLRDEGETMALEAMAVIRVTLEH